MKQFSWVICLSMALVFMHSSLTFAQTPRPTPTNEPDSSSSSNNNEEANGSIRGTAYLDENGDGLCVDTGEPTHAGVPIEFVSNDGEFTTFLATGDDGTFGLVAAAYGTWTVSARPNANDFIVTSATSQSIFIGSEEPLALNVDFCVQEVGGPITAGGDIANFSPTTTFLPASGAAADNTGYYMALVVGVILLSTGAFIQVRKRNLAKAHIE